MVKEGRFAWLGKSRLQSWEMMRNYTREWNNVFKYLRVKEMRFRWIWSRATVHGVTKELDTT